jgi:hypothetical protein
MRALQRILLAHVPVGDHLLAVGIRLNAEHDVVVQQPHGLGIGAADQLVNGFHQLLRADGLAGVQAAVDPHDGFAVASPAARACSSVTPSAWASFCEMVLYFREVLDVVGRRDNRHVLRPAKPGLADFDQLHAVGFGGKFLPVASSCV